MVLPGVVWLTHTLGYTDGQLPDTIVPILQCCCKSLKQLHPADLAATHCHTFEMTSMAMSTFKAS